MPNFTTFTKLKARFVKSANSDGSQNKEESYWEVWAGSDFLMKISVKELCNMNSTLSYDSIATRVFGAELIEQIKNAKKL